MRTINRESIIMHSGGNTVQFHTEEPQPHNPGWMSFQVIRRNSLPFILNPG